MVGSILFGKRVDGQRRRSPADPEAEAVATYGSAGTWHLPGTYVLVSVFFAAFVLYYFVNWKYLSRDLADGLSRMRSPVIAHPRAVPLR